MTRLRISLTSLTLTLAVAGCAKKTPAETESPDQPGSDADGDDQAATPSRARTVTGAKAAGNRVKGQLRLSSDEPPRPEDDDLGPASGDGKLLVEGFVPNAAAPGTMVEVFGRGFSPDVGKNKVTVGGKPWSVVKVGSDRLLAIVPEQATDGPIAIAVGKSKVATDATFRTMASDSAFAVEAGTRNGLLGDVWAAGGDVTDLPDFAQLGEPHSVFAMGQLDVAPHGGPAGVLGPQAPANDNFAVRLSGSLNVVGAAEYEFCLNSSDGSRLLLEDTLVVDNPGVHEPTKVCELAYLEPGEYDIVVEYFHGTGSELALQLLWGKDGGTPVVVPSDVLFRPDRHPSVPVIADEAGAAKKPRKKAAGTPR